jgi:hypothetical protein
VEAGVGGPGDTDHTVQGKPAQETVREWFGLSPTPVKTCLRLQIDRFPRRPSYVRARGQVCGMTHGVVRVVLLRHVRHDWRRVSVRRTRVVDGRFSTRVRLRPAAEGVQAMVSGSGRFSGSRSAVVPLGRARAR